MHGISVPPTLAGSIQGPAEVTPLSVVGRVRECLTREGQQFEHFTKISYGVLESDIVMLQNHMPVIL